MHTKSRRYATGSGASNRLIKSAHRKKLNVRRLYKNANASNAKISLGKNRSRKSSRTSLLHSKLNLIDRRGRCSN